MRLYKYLAGKKAFRYNYEKSKSNLTGGKR